MMKKLICLCLALTFALCGCTSVEASQTESGSEKESESTAAQNNDAAEPSAALTEREDEKESMAEKMLKVMSLREKIGQLFVVRPEALGGNETVFDDNTAEALRTYPVGGIALFGKNIIDSEQLTALTARFKEYGMLIGIDEEGGTVSRIAKNPRFDVQRFGSMGDVKTRDEAENIGKTIGGYLKKYGINLNFAPVADVNSNPDNPVIGDRAFSCDAKTVSLMVSGYIDGCHEAGVMTSIKHFPGHGDTGSDTHTGAVTLSKTWEELESLELIPFKDNLDKTDCVMVSHITLTKVADDAFPASLSYDIVTKRLRRELGFDGVIITDSLEMGAVRENTDFEPAVQAIKAGCDIVLMPQSLEKSFNAMYDALEKGEIDEKRLDESVLRILKLKEKYGLLQPE